MDFASLDDKTLSSLSNKVQSILSKDSYQDDKASKSDRRFVEPRLSTEKSRPGKGKRTGSGRSRLPNDNVTTSTSSKPAGVGSQSLRLMSQSKGQRQKQPHLRMTPGNANPKAVQQGREGVRASTKRLKRPGATFEATERPIPYSRSTKSIAKSKPHERQQQTMPVTSDRSSMISFHDRPDWFNAPLPVIAPDDRPDISQATISKLFAHSKELLRQENQRYANSKSSSSSHKFYSTIMSSGTLSDKVSALTLSIQESPLHNMHALETLVGLAKKRSRSQAVQVLGALKDLFSAGSVLPVDRKLCAFAAQPSLTAVPEASMKAWGELQPLPSPLQEAHLIYWAFEDWLKATYFDVVKLLEVWCNDEIVYSRLKAVDYTYELLREKPEQEANLLRLLVNKMGDPEKRVASKASSNLVQLQLPHPFMKPNIISTIESDVLFKPGQSLHAKYYAVITLNQTVLQGHQQEVVVKILEIYFALFLSLLESQQSHATIRAKQEELNVKPGRKGLRVNEGTAKRFKSSRNPQAHDAELTDKIVSAILTGINRAFPFASAKDDFFEKHLDILFKITHSSNFNTSLQALMLLQQLSSFHTPASDRFYRTLYESLLDPRLLTTSKQTLYINLLFRAMKADPDPRRVQAFVKRISQIVAMHQPSFVCAAIYLVKELAIAFPSLHTLLDQAETDGSDGEDGITDTSEEAVGNATKNVGQHQAAHYDGRKRDPQFSNAEKSCLWEMDPLLCHFHPSVSMFAQKLLAREDSIDTRPDLSMHSLMGFLDRFVYKNPRKSTSGLRGASVMQPLAAAASRAHVLVSANNHVRRLAPPINSLASQPGKANKTQPDEIFFHKYFKAKATGKDGASKETAKERKRATEGPKDEENEQVEEENIWKALVESRPELEADEDSGLDLESDLSDPEMVEGESEGHESSELDSVASGERNGEEFDAGSGVHQDGDDVFQAEEAGKRHAELPLREHQANGRARKKRKTLKGLPTFASAEDYAQMLEDGDRNELS